ncbi:unnamed protein product [Echinostoma caproni]|uniref:CHCH domain-containing protein n=1 Tax=Echinostoma caproni TaxID=27848 RepID=A0A3P8CPK7_9TREM|nr:unnamed protein product [Echinostoma caproni]
MCFGDQFRCTESPRLHHTETKIDCNIEEEDDPVIAMIKRTGCLEEHYDVLDCKYEKKDWRLCQDVVKAFRDCMNQSKRKSQ